MRPLFNAEDNVKAKNSIWNPYSGGSFRWTSPTTFIYATSGSLITQGTWVYNVTTNKIQKVSSLIAEKFLVLGNQEYVVFLANSKLFRVKPDGTDVQEIPTTTKIGTYSEFVSLLREY